MSSYCRAGKRRNARICGYLRSASPHTLYPDYAWALSRYDSEGDLNESLKKLAFPCRALAA